MVLVTAILIATPAFPVRRLDGRLSVDRVLAEDAIQVCRAEESRATTSAWIWGIAGAGLAAYAITAFAGGHGSDSGLKYFAAIGAIGSGGGSWTAWSRRNSMRDLREAMAGEVAATGPDYGFSPGTIQRAGGEFRRLHASLISASAGSVRAGCIMPVLLSGMAVFGFSLGSSAGADLAGISFAGALGIGGPSMLYYLNIKRDLDRMDALMPRWSQTFRDLKKEGI